MRIGEASNASGVPERMIRHYEKLGLIPAPDRRSSGYRVYGVDDVRRLRFIAQARDLGFSMANIAEAMVAWGGEGIDAVAIKWKAEIARKLEALDALRVELDDVGLQRAIAAAE